MILKTAEERAAEVRAEAEAREAAKAAKKAEKVEAKKVEEPQEAYVDYKALAAAEEKRAASLKVETEKLQRELDPALDKQMKRTETKPHVVLTELLNKHENATDALAALHAAINQMREEEAENVVRARAPEREEGNLDHLTPSQRERTLREMAAGRANSERAAAQQAKLREAKAKQDKEITAKQDQLALLQAELEKAQATINVLRHNPTVNEVFPTIAADKVHSTGI